MLQGHTLLDRVSDMLPYGIVLWQRRRHLYQRWLYLDAGRHSAMGSRQRRQIEAEVKELILNYELKIHNYFIASTSALDNPAILQISDSG